MSRGPFAPNMDHAYYYQGKLEAYRKALQILNNSGAFGAWHVRADLEELIAEARDNKALEEEEGEE